MYDFQLKLEKGLTVIFKTLNKKIPIEIEFGAAPLG